jgi:Transposase Tn5 dimerisation domain
MAWRIFSATMLARAVPEMPCSVRLALDEWHALSCAIHHCPTPPEEPPSLDQAVRWMAQLGGFVGRRRRDQPGTDTLWRGFQHFMDLTKMDRILLANPSFSS